MAGRSASLALLGLVGLGLGAAWRSSRLYAPDPHCGEARGSLPEPGPIATHAGRYPQAPPPPCARNRHGEEERLGSVVATHWFVEAGGPTWHFVTTGDPGRRRGGGAGWERKLPVVLLHGFPGSWWSLHPQLEALALAGYPTVAIDLIPYGQSDKDRGLDYRYASIAAGVLRLLDRIRVSDFHLVAHDRGAVVADHLLALPGAERRVGRYVRMQQQAARASGEDGPPLRMMGSPAGVLLFKSRRFPTLVYRGRLVARPLPRETLERLDYEFKYRGIAEAAPLSFRTSSENLELVDRRERLFAHMTMPVLFLQGRLDVGQPPEDFFRVEEAVADGTLRFVEAGHFLQLEAPEAVNAQILAFLSLGERAPGVHNRRAAGRVLDE